MTTSTKRVAAPKKPDGWWEPGLAADIVRARVQSAVWDFDRVIAETEKVWGHDRLPYIVSADTRARWWRAVDALNEAIKANDADRTKALVENLIRGVGRMVEEAKAAGHAPLEPDVWTGRFKNGRTFRIVRSYPEHAARFDDDTPTFSLEEVGRILDDHYHAVVRVKEQWPGATVLDKPRSPIAEELNDDIPF